MNHLVVYEYELLKVGEGLSLAQLDALAQFNERHGEKYFQLLHRAIRFKNYVGVLQVGALQIEILPKMDRGQVGAPLRSALVELLRSAELLKIDFPTAAQLELKQSSLLNLYIQAFLQAVENLMQQGLSRTYEQEIKQSATWKGQIQFPLQMRQSWRAKKTIISKQTSYNYQNRWHQILYAALLQLLKIPIDLHLQHWVERLLLDFPAQKEVKLEEKDFRNLHYDSKRLVYKNAMQLAELILLGYQPQLKSGAYAVFGLLFDMNRLYEDYVYRQLNRALEEEEVLERQPASLFWADKKLRPDLLLKIGAKQLVLDCKWKFLDKPEPNDHDLRQIYVYQQHFGAVEGWLLYPSNKKLPSFVEPFVALGEGQPTAKARMIWLDLLDEQGNLNQNLGRELIRLARNLLVD